MNMCQIFSGGALAALALTACTAAPAETAEPAARATAAPIPASSPAQAADVLPQLPQNYWQARKLLIETGFTPVNVTSEGLTVCVAEMEGADVPYGECQAEMVLPEVEACAGTGMANCRIEWRSPAGRNLLIFTVGEPQPGVIETMEWSTDPDAPAGQD